MQGANISGVGARGDDNAMGLHPGEIPGHDRVDGAGPAEPGDKTPGQVRQIVEAGDGVGIAQAPFDIA